MRDWNASPISQETPKTLLGAIEAHHEVQIDTGLAPPSAARAAGAEEGRAKTVLPGDANAAAAPPD
jgi:hypothetical protein